MGITNILLASLVVISFLRWITEMSQNYKLGEIKKLFARMVEIELPALTAAISEIEHPSDSAAPPDYVVWPSRINKNGFGIRQ